MTRLRWTPGVAIALAAALLTSCHNLEDPASAAQSQLVVHAVLNPLAPQLVILIQRARTGTSAGNAAGGAEEPVVDAQVAIAAPNGVVMRSSRSSGGAYQFDPVQDGVDLTQAGTYALQVRTPRGEVVLGTTTMPRGTSQLSGTILLQALARGRDTLRLSWPRVPGARSYEVLVRSTGYTTFADTAIAIAADALSIGGDPVFGFGRDQDVIVSAVDANYYDYYRAQSDPFAGTTSHLTGAAGVFGSIVPILEVQFLVR